MKVFFKVLIAVILGLILGSFVNMGLIILGGNLIAPPEGVDPTDGESLKYAMEHNLFEFKHFIFPFLAHALGTFIGAIIGCKIAPERTGIVAGLIGVLFMAGGVANAFMINPPLYMTVIDLVLAYIPFAFWAYRLMPTRASN